MALTKVSYSMIDGIGINAADYGVPSDGVTNATTTIQSMIDFAASNGNVKEIYFPPGTYLLLSPAGETGEPRSYAAAVIFRNLKNIVIRGAKGTKFTQGPGGAGAPEYGMFRFEQCENIELCHFNADGSGIDIHTTGAARSSFAFICNHDLNTKIDLASPNKNIHIHHLKLDNFGGGIVSATRTEAGFPYPLVTEGISIHDIQATNISGQNHFVGITYSTNVHVYNCKVTNPLTATAQIGNTFSDMSAGVINAMVENNYAIGFTGGAKAESHTGAGVASNEDRFSQNVTFRNNTFEQIGDPITMIYPGPSGGGWYGIKLNGINHSAYNNTITARTTNRTTGGLYQGIQLTTVSTTPVESIHTVFGNSILGPVVGINHDSPVDTLHKYVVNIYGNKIMDTYVPATPTASNDGAGMLLGRNATVYNNRFYRTKYSAISVNTADQTIIRDNIAYNCVVNSNPVISDTVVFEQTQTGLVGYFEFSNNMIFDDRGASAASYGYLLRAGIIQQNEYIFNPGVTDAVKTAVSYDIYFSTIGTSLLVNGTADVGPRTVYTSGTPASVYPWNSRAWRVGDRAVNNTPAVGQPKSWVCTVAGTPGTWVSEGNL